MTRIALCGFVRDITNSRFDFGETIDALLPIIDEATFAVSSESTDGSEERLQEHTARWEQDHNTPVNIYSYDWPEDITKVSFSDAYNDLLARTSGDWNLRIFQDRRIDPRSIERIRQTIDEHPEAAVIRFQEREGGKQRMKADLLVRSDVRYDGKRLEHPLRRTDYQGTIAEACITPDEIVAPSDLRVVHEASQDGPEKTAWRKALANEEILRIRRLQAQTGQEPDNAALHYTIGMRLMNMVKTPKDSAISYAQARKMFERAAVLEPDKPASYIRIGDCHYLSNRVRAAERFYKEAARLGSDCAYSRLDTLQGAGEKPFL